jgi:hypothetical protein
LAVEPYEIRYTTLARAALGDHLLRFEAQFRDELAELLEDGEVTDLLFHSTEFDDRLFVGTWREQGWLLVDSAHEEESEIRSGPREGEKIILPRPDSE